MNRIGVLLTNIGTPDEATPEAVGRYLRQFLMDEYVLDMPYLKRWLLVNRIIVPRRKFSSAKHYQEVQTEEGSPLMVFTKRFAAALSAELSSNHGEYLVEIGMRYGNPSIAAALARLKSGNIDRLIAFPLYPQYTQSSFQTAIVETKKRAQRFRLSNRLTIVPPFHSDPGFITACADRLANHLKTNSPDYILFSFHGVPVRHIKQIDTSGRHCLASPDCCEQIGPANQNCYRAHCLATTRAIARELGLKDDQYTMCFQSQFGKDEWTAPALESLLRELPARGVKTVAVFCPSFVADCLETLEEIGMRGRDEFKEAGGQELTLIPCLNSDPLWIKAAANLIIEAAGKQTRPAIAGG